MPKQWENFLQERGLLPFAIDTLKWRIQDGRLYIDYPAIPKLNVKSISRYRTSPNRKPKFKKSQTPIPYFLQYETNRSVLIIVEGETDSATAAGAGFSVLGIPGATTWKQEWWALAEDFEKSVVLLDSDEAGADLLNRLATTKPDDISLFVAPPALLKTGAKDINDIHQQNNGDFSKTAQSIKTLINTAQPLKTVTSQEELIETLCDRLDEVTEPEDEDRKALCIFHEENTPSMDFGPKGFMCFGCGKHGTLKTLAAMRGIALVSSNRTESAVKYAVKNGAICAAKQTEYGTVYVPLCNFQATITKEIIKDDGVEQSRLFELQGSLQNGKTLPKISVPADKFSSLGWVVSMWGAEANVEAGTSVKDKLRAAIQHLSTSIETETVYTHIGWRRTSDGKWVYLFSGGGVGIDNVTVSPDIESLKMYELAEKPLNASPSLELLDVGPPNIMIPLIAAAYRAPTCCLLYPSVTLWLYGRTGSFKSTLAALALNHFGKRFTGENLPGNWISTENALEKAISVAHDVPFVIDDYAPEISRKSTEELKRKATRLIREIGNRQGRARLKSDTTGRPEYTPNSMVISTGEQPPAEIESINARTILVECSADKINIEKLSEMQTKTRQLVGAMRGYIEWLAPQMDTLEDELHAKFIELRAKAGTEGHKRVRSGIVHLALGWHLFLEYALQSGSISPEQKEALWGTGWDVFMELTNSIVAYMKETNPTNMFFNALNELLIQGSVYITDHKTGISVFGEDFKRTAELIGWTDENYLYLMPDATMKNVISFLRSQNIEFPLSKTAFGDMLKTTGIVICSNNRISRQIRIPGGGRAYVWQINKTTVNLNSGGD